MIVASTPGQEIIELGAKIKEEEICSKKENIEHLEEVKEDFKVKEAEGASNINVLTHTTIGRTVTFKKKIEDKIKKQTRGATAEKFLEETIGM